MKYEQEAHKLQVQAAKPGRNVLRSIISAKLFSLEINFQFFASSFS
jgi:hypothetical protein